MRNVRRPLPSFVSMLDSTIAGQYQQHLVHRNTRRSLDIIHMKVESTGTVLEGCFRAWITERMNVNGELVS